jgi:sialic acid synthase SpsE
VIETALGTGVKEPVAAEVETALVSRKSLHWARDLDAGDRIEATDLVALRPGTGLSPAWFGRVTGARVVRRVHGGSAVTQADLEDGRE